MGKLKIVEVKWKDIVSHDGWHTQGKVDKLVMDDEDVIVNHVAYLYEEDENQVVLVDSFFEKKDQYGTIHRIPKGCIISIKEIQST